MRMLNNRLPIESVTRRRLGQDRRATKCADTRLLSKRLGDSQVWRRRTASGCLQTIREHTLNHLRTLRRWAVSGDAAGRCNNLLAAWSVKYAVTALGESLPSVG